MRPPALDAASAPADHSVSSTPVSLDELQALADRATGRQLRLGDPVWATAFRLHHRHAFSYRSGRVFLAGDAAHIHSPAGAQGMNTGIQDAANLGWKLGLVVRGHAPDDLLDSYDAERRPVGESVLRFTDRAFTAATSTNPVVRGVRSRLVPRLLPMALHFRLGRAPAFRTISQLGVSYRPIPPYGPAAGWPSGALGPATGCRMRKGRGTGTTAPSMRHSSPQRSVCCWPGPPTAGANPTWPRWPSGTAHC